MPGLIGTQNDDVLTGTSGEDFIDGGWGDDTVDAGDGNDTIVDSGGSNTLRGGAGNDFISLTAESYGGTVYEGVPRTNLIEAGDGNDTVEVTNYGRYNSFAVDLGAGADLLTIAHFWGPSGRITTGAGADRIVLKAVDFVPLVVTDFTAGQGGDILDLGAAVEGLLADRYHAANPFASGHLLLVQDGADVIVRVDIDGAAGAGSDGFYIYDLFRLTNVNAADLTAYNLAGYAPDGSDLVRTTINGTSVSESINADIGGSDLFGLGGDDQLTGNIGGDVLDGGACNDHLNGGTGSDLLRGGDGDDVLFDPSGADTLDGGAGNDTIDIYRTEFAGTEPVTIIGGLGSDFVRFDSYHDVALVVDLGAGNDRFELPDYLESVQLTLGAGQDRVVFGQIYFFDIERPKGVVITDFATGNAGDVLEVDRAILGNWDGVSNPFAGGYLVLQQSGADTLVIYDHDGTGGSTPRFELARLVGVDASTLTAVNFGGFAPDGSPSSLGPNAPTAGDDHLVGSNGSDRIDGGDGNDLIEERKAGSDTLIGGAGDDRIILLRYDAFFPDAESQVVTIDAGTGRDTVELGWSSGSLTVDLGADDDRLLIHGTPERGSMITLGTGADVIELAPGSSSNFMGPITITDFATGAGGDRLDWAIYAEHRAWNGDPDFNPFYEGNARLVQVGADTHLQIGDFGNHQSTNTLLPTVMVFANTNVADFTAENLGYAPFHPTASGSDGDDTLNGTAGLDVLHGNAGNDRLDGLGGDDVLWAHDGSDTLLGGIGNDFLRGGLGDDLLQGGVGADNLDGGPGVDTVDGGDGDDRIFDWQGSGIVTGGAGNDRISIYLAWNKASGAGFGTLTGGDGNDVIEVENIYVQTGYAVDLGAGDDVLRFEHPFGPVTLGTGRDTVQWGSSYNINGLLVITDFEAGDGGDLFDLEAFLEHPLGLYSSEGFPEGFDPFALGHIELVQIGTEVRLYFHRQGYDAVEYAEGAVVRFLDTNLSDFTAANFGGFNPHVDPNWTTVLYADRTIGANEVREEVNVTAVNGKSAGFMFGFGVNAQLVNHGTIISRADGAIGAGSATGIYAGPGGPTGKVFTNASDGLLLVQGEFVDAIGGTNFAETYGVYGDVWFRNYGQVEVSAASGTAFGHYSTSGQFTNHGTLTVTSPYEAYGVYVHNSAAFTNGGEIRVHGGEFAIGLNWGSATHPGFNNAGTITVTTDPKSPYASIGVRIGGRTDVEYHHYNSGTITADIAVYADAYARTGPGAYEIVDHLHNSGTINGDVMLAAGNDVVDNSGTMSGRTLLEDGNDRYEGTGGVHHGTVEGGGGNDVLRGGASSELFYGDTGNDDLSSGGGDDLLDGGAGDDRINGGAGYDLASYAEASAAVVVDLSLTSAQNTVGAGVDTLSGIEDLAGSAFADRLTGNGGSNYLYGMAGSDRLFGSAGNDVLDGGTGEDVMYGGAGNDTFVVDHVSDATVELAGEGVDEVLASRAYTLRDNVENLTQTGIYSIRGTGNALDNVMTGNSGSNRLFGLDGSDRLIGNEGTDILDGGAGIDKMFGGAGNDTYIVDSTSDQLVEYASEGRDTVQTSVTRTLGANFEWLVMTGTGNIRGTGNELANVLKGNAGANVLYGRAGNDKIYAREGADVVSGEEGNDWLEGGAGRDRFYGGSGSDRFVFRDGDFSGVTSSTADQIHDFGDAEGDRIRLDLVDADTGTAGVQAFAFLGTGAFTGTAGELRYEQIGANTFVQGDTDGDGVADFWIRLDGLHTLGTDDFIL